MLLARRSLLTAAGYGAALGLLPAKALAAEGGERWLKAPTFPSDEKKWKVYKGWRPVRSSGFRLDYQLLPATSPQRYLINNYGHGGGGITLSWGCAQQVVRWIEVMNRDRPIKKVAILGAGVIGLTTAKLIMESFPQISVVAYGENIDGSGNGTTSDNAGGQFAPSFRAFRAQELSAEALADRQGPYTDADIVRISYDRFLADAGKGFYSVSHRNNYCGGSLPAPDLLKTLRALSGLDPRESNAQYKSRRPLAWDNSTSSSHPFNLSAAASIPGIRGTLMYPTLLIEVPSLMSWLRVHVKRQKISYINRPEDVYHLSDDVIINCLGSGAKTVSVDDTVRLTPTLGVVVGLPREANLNYLFSGPGYIFPRGDRTIIGGWAEEGLAGDYRSIPEDHCMSVARGLVLAMQSFTNGTALGRLPDCYSSMDRVNGTPLYDRDNTADPGNLRGLCDG